MSGLIAAGIGAAVSIGTTIFGASRAKKQRRKAERKAKRLNAKIEHLEKNRTKIQKVLAREMTTKNVPKIIFEVDSTFNNVLRINELLDRTIENE